MKKPSIDAPETLSEFNKYRQPDGEPRFTDIQNITWSGRTVWETGRDQYQGPNLNPNQHQ